MGIFLAIALLFSVPSFADTYFLDLSGRVPSKNASELNGELQKTFGDPLEAAKKSVLFSYTKQAEGDGHFFLHLILESTDSDHLSDFENFIHSFEGSDFNGVKVHFQKVKEISQTSTLQAGTYEDTDEAFHQTFEMPRHQIFASAREWLNFSNEYGFALLSRDHRRFLAYLEKFTNNEQDFFHLQNHVLPMSNMVAIAPQTYVLLDDNRIVGPDFDTLPFLPFRFFRNCYLADYENGMCEKAKN